MNVKNSIFFLILLTGLNSNVLCLANGNRLSNPVIDYLNKFSVPKSKVNYYNATHNLLIPLYSAAKYGDEGLEKAFRRFFKENSPSKKIGDDYLLDDLHFVYLYCEYIRLMPNNFDNAEFSYIRKYLLRYWNNAIGNVWSDEKQNFLGKKSRINYLLKHGDRQYKAEERYLAALTDFDMFAMSIGTSLATIERKQYGKTTVQLHEVANLWFECLVRYSIFSTEDRWLLQPGIWAGYPDYIYAGYSLLKDVKKPKMVKGIGSDVSHFSRMPAFLKTLEAYYINDQLALKFVRRLIRGLGRQFVHAVVQLPSKYYLYRFKNYMDGTNGFYRYNYSQKGVGYGPFQNAKHVFFGWWQLLNNKQIQAIYKHVRLNFSQYYSIEDYKWTDYDIEDSKLYYRFLIGMY